MNYDDWKLATPEEEEVNECAYCGAECESDYCDSKCANAEF